MDAVYKDDEQLLHEFKELIKQISKELINDSVIVDLKNTQKGINETMHTVELLFKDALSKFVKDLNVLIIDAERCYSAIPSKIEMLHKSINTLESLKNDFNQLLNSSNVLEELRSIRDLIDVVDRENKQYYSALNSQIYQVIGEQESLESKIASMNIKMLNGFVEIKENQNRLLDAIKNNHI